MKDGGSAFPVIGKHSPDGRMELDSTGMSIRDYFAGQALAGVLPNENEQDGFFKTCENRAKWCYEMADAMIAAREKTE